MSRNHKKVPASIGIFGATGHIGGPMAHWLRYHAPDVRVRLITSRQGSVAGLEAAFPGCEVVVGDYYDLPSLTEAVAGLEGLFVVTTTGTREEPAMTNLISAVNASNSLIHMIRLVGVFPSIHPQRIPKALSRFGFGLETQHPIARRLLDDSGLPVTYFNIGASFMDNLLNPRIYSLGPGTLAWPDRCVPYIDPREIGEAAARILLSDDHRHLHQFHTLNNGQDNLHEHEVVEMMRDVLRIDISYDPSREALFAIMQPAVDLGFIPPELPEYLWEFFRYEDDNDVAWVLNTFLERTLGRKPTTMRSWIQEHAGQLRRNLTEAR
ncbi:NmrA family NAD(P)-binding protein [Sphingobium sp.]|uniref:NmrA family NAD(P)-binding protein n=1 Tax=Sphingobium sp. TaxID=1912891 RepID=UPI0028BD7721|nr:NmrA family NAD(P)-binding protein [Sphingobium sp.]